MEDAPVAFIRKYKNNLDWRSVCIRSKNIDVSFIEEFYDSINWDAISRNRHCMTEDILETYKDMIDWKVVSIIQIMPYQTIIKYIDRLNINYVYINAVITNNLTVEEKTLIKNMIDIRNEFS